jgi:hypothetical protein
MHVPPTNREIWRYQYDEQGHALATWIYHPSRVKKGESAEEKAMTLRKLIELTSPNR